jgi:hypothetical protein
VTIDSALFAPAMTHARSATPAVHEGRHRRVFPDLVVHLVFDDLSEYRLGPDTADGRTLGHLAGWLVER